MEKIGNELNLQNSTKPAISFLLILFLSFLGFTTLGPFLGILFALPFPGFDLDNMLAILENPAGFPDSKIPLLVIQGVSSIVGFIIIPVLFLVGLKKESMKIFFQAKTATPTLIIIASLFTISFLIVNSVFVEWNANLKLPEFMSGFEEWARNLEDNAAVLTEFLTDFSGFGHFLLAFLVIAIIPGFGEELLFRGLLQNYATGFLRNPHLAILLTSIIFSAIHLQFYGFVPRALLGIAFGYLYLWSGNLLLPVIAHSVNNGFTLLMMYMYSTNAIGFDIDSSEPPNSIAIIPAFIISAMLLYVFYKNSTRIRTQDGNMGNGV